MNVTVVHTRCLSFDDSSVGATKVASATQTGNSLRPKSQEAGLIGLIGFVGQFRV